MREDLNREGNVLDDDRGAALADGTHRREHAGPYLPQQCLFLRQVSELRRLAQLQPGNRIGGDLLQNAGARSRRRIETRPAIRRRFLAMSELTVERRA